MRIIYLPIEPLEERYTAQYFRWFQTVFNKLGVDYLLIHPGALSDRIRDGSFLDVCGTNYYKAMQLAEVCKMCYHKEIKDTDIIFLGDAWFPGLEMLAYIRDGLKLNFKIVGLLFAGTYDPFDFLSQKGMGHWGKPLEESWFRIVDKFFMATNFHRRLVWDTRDIDSNKLVVTGHPFYWEREEVNFGLKDRIVVFPHRKDPEKNPHLFREMEKVLNMKKLSFLMTKDECSSKEEYYRMLENSIVSVSFADQETFGFAMIESVFAGAFPVVPNKLSYTELYNPLFTYTSFKECCDLVRKLAKFSVGLLESKDVHMNYHAIREDNKKTLKNLCESAIPKMVDECKKLVGES